jgi:NAD(P)-dependent dehydrogenase (short-subunit alcohol dehydrogenase family)
MAARQWQGTQTQSAPGPTDFSAIIRPPYSPRRRVINNFHNKTAFITGGAAGIGLGMARAFAERGMNLALIDIDAEALAQASAALTATGCKVRTFALDITDIDQLKQAVAATAAAFGGINIVCANAGVTGFLGPLQHGSEADWNWIIDVNIKGTVNTIQAALPHVLEHEHDGHVVITSSISGLRVHNPSRGQGMYNTTKFAMVGLGEALALDLEPHGIGVSVVCPGVVNTDISNAGRNRQARYGGAFASASADFVLAKAAKSGTDPLIFGRWVVKAVERNQLIVITHPQDRDQVEARHARIMQAFEDCASLTAQ